MNDNKRSENLGGKAVKSVAWLSVGQLCRQAFAFGTNLILARMLVPDDFGLFGMTYVAAEIAQVFIAFGLGATIVQRQVTAPAVLTTCFWFNVAVGAAAGVCLIVTGPALSAYFGRVEVNDLVLPLAFNMLVAGASVVPQALLTQQLRFESMTIAQIVGSVVASVTALVLATAGVGVWALAAQPLVGNIVTGAMMLHECRWRPGFKPALRHLTGMLNLSLNLLGSNLVATAGRNMHTFVIGRFLGASALGAYGLASGLTGTVLFQITSVIVRVLFPTLSVLKNEPERLATAWLTANAAVAITTVPIMFGTAALAPDVVRVLFGNQWDMAIDVLRILAVSMAVQSALTTSGTVLLTFGRGDLLLKTSVVTAVLTGIAYLSGTVLGGLVGAAWCYLVVCVGTHLWMAALACKEIALPLRVLVKQLAPPFLCSAAMALVVHATVVQLAAYPPFVRLMLCAIVGASVYVALLLAFARPATIALFNRIRQQF